jgi:hypothetical protein
MYILHLLILCVFNHVVFMLFVTRVLLIPYVAKGEDHNGEQVISTPRDQVRHDD